MGSAELVRARERLEREGLTCVILAGDVCFCSRERGVKPLLDCLEEGTLPRGGVAADRVVGRAAAFLYVLLGVTELYAAVLSRPAAEVLERYGIAYTCDTLTQGIRNRAGTGACPMESAVMEVEDATSVPALLYQKLRTLKK